MENSLKKKRQTEKKTMKEIASAAGISESYYCLIENGERIPPVKTAKKIAEVLGIDWTRFYEVDEVL